MVHWGHCNIAATFCLSIDTVIDDSLNINVAIIKEIINGAVTVVWELNSSENTMHGEHVLARTGKYCLNI